MSKLDPAHQSKPFFKIFVRIARHRGLTCRSNDRKVAQVAGWTDRMLDIKEQNQAEKQRRNTVVEVLQNLPDCGVVDERRADGSRTLIYIQTPAGAEHE